MALRHTGVYATEEEVEKISRLYEEARRTPVIALSSEDALAGRDFASAAMDRVQQAIEEAAEAHGLPRTPKHYGLDLNLEYDDQVPDVFGRQGRVTRSAEFVTDDGVV
jgi:hypothetical protein